MRHMRSCGRWTDRVVVVMLGVALLEEAVNVISPRTCRRWLKCGGDLFQVEAHQTSLHCEAMCLTAPPVLSTAQQLK